MRQRLWLWIASLSLLAAWTVYAQEVRPPRGEPRILSGQDLGFRLEGRDIRTGNPVGTWVVRLNGQWLPIGSTPAVHPLR